MPVEVALVANIYDEIPRFLNTFINYVDSPRPSFIYKAPLIIRTYFWTTMNVFHVFLFYLLTVIALGCQSTIPLTTVDMLINIWHYITSKSSSIIFQAFFCVATLLLLRWAPVLRPSARSHLRTGILLILATAVLTIVSAQFQRLIDIPVMQQAVELKGKIVEYSHVLYDYVPKNFAAINFWWGNVAEGNSPSPTPIPQPPNRTSWILLSIYSCIVTIFSVLAFIAAILGLTAVETVAAGVYIYIFLPEILSYLLQICLLRPDNSIYRLSPRIHFRRGAKIIYSDLPEDLVSSPTSKRIYTNLLEMKYDVSEVPSAQFSIITFSKIIEHTLFTKLAVWLARAPHFSKVRSKAAIWARRQAVAQERRVKLVFLNLDRKPVQPFSHDAIYCAFDLRYRCRFSGLAEIINDHSVVVTALETRAGNILFKISAHDNIQVISKDSTITIAHIRICEFSPGRIGGELFKMCPQIDAPIDNNGVIVIGPSSWPITFTAVLAQGLKNKGYPYNVFATIAGKRIPPISSVIAVGNSILQLEYMFPPAFVPENLVLLEPKLPCSILQNRPLTTATGNVLIVTEDQQRVEVGNSTRLKEIPCTQTEFKDSIRYYSDYIISWLQPTAMLLQVAPPMFELPWDQLINHLVDRNV